MSRQLGFLQAYRHLHYLEAAWMLLLLLQQQPPHQVLCPVVPFCLHAAQGAARLQLGGLLKLPVELHEQLQIQDWWCSQQQQDFRACIERFRGRSRAGVRRGAAYYALSREASSHHLP